MLGFDQKWAVLMTTFTGAHSIGYSKKPEADRVFMRDVLKLPYVDSGDGWLIFGLPPSEVAFHSTKNNVEEFYLITDDVEDLIVQMKKHRVKCSPFRDNPGDC